MIKWLGFFLSYFIGRIMNPVSNVAQGFGREALELVFERARIAMKVVAVGWMSSLLFVVSLVTGLIELSRATTATGAIYVSPALGTAMVLFLLSLAGFAYTISSLPWKKVTTPSEAFLKQENFLHQAQQAGVPMHPLAEAAIQLMHHYIATHPSPNAAAGNTNPGATPRSEHARAHDHARERGFDA